MNLGKKHILIFFWIIAGLLHAEAQDEQYLRLSFTRQNNFTYVTFLDLNTKWKSDKYRGELYLHHDNLVNSARKEDPFVQLFVRINLWQYYDFKPKLSLAAWTEPDLFINSKNIRFSQYAGLQYRPIEGVEITPLIGFSWDYRNQVDKLDEGISPALRIRARHKWDDGLETQTNIFLRTKDIEPRHQRNVVVSSLWHKAFAEFADLSFGLKAGSNEIDDYRSESIEKIKSDTLNPLINLRYQIHPNLYWDSQNEFQITRRQIDYTLNTGTRTEFNDLAFLQNHFYTQQKLSYSRKKLSAHMLYEYEYIIRRYELENSQGLSTLDYEKLVKREKQKDYERNFNALEFYLNWRAHAKHTFVFTGYDRYLQYDTPGVDNFDDHDELNYGLATEWKSRWSRKFSTRYKITGNVRRYAFLFKERSQDNYTQQALRLEFGYRWEPFRNFFLQGDQFLYVSYNIKDFADRNLTNRATRNLESRLKSRYKLNNSHLLSFSGYRKESHVSYIKWETFTETTLDTNLVYIFEFNDEIKVKSPWKKSRIFLDIGYKHFSQSRFQNTSMIDLSNLLQPINLKRRTIQTGPVTGLRIRKAAPSTIELSIWWQYQQQDFRFRRTDRLSNLSASFREADLGEITRAFRPFINLKANFRLGL